MQIKSGNKNVNVAHASQVSASEGATAAELATALGEVRESSVLKSTIADGNNVMMQFQDEDFQDVAGIG